MNYSNRLFLLLVFLTQQGFAQFSASHKIEYQLGNIPNVIPTGLSTAYNQLNLQYGKGRFDGGMRFESFTHKDKDLDYYQVTQGYLQYKDSKFDIRVGSIYDLIGRGLLMRMYEIPGTVYEDGAFRIRHGFYRDLNGFRVQYRTDWLSLKVLRGKPLVSGLPPTFDVEDRRVDLIEAVEANWKFRGITLGTNFLRNSPEAEHREKKDYTGLSLNTPLPFSSTLYIEVAQQYDSDTQFDLSQNNPHAIYGSLNTTVSGIGVSLEYKEYHDFLLGAGFNDPPPLIREQRWVTLNRSTHKLNLLNESGVQLELFYPFDDGSVLTFNWTHAVNDIYEKFVYKEYFVELNKPFGRQNLKAFLDYAEDPFKGESERISGGAELEVRVKRRSSVILEAEYQQYRRTLYPEGDVSNVVFKAGFAAGSKWSVTAITEFSTDPFATDDISTLEIETDTRMWLGVVGSLKLKRRHKLHLFVGERRGGPACASGICYDVLDFKGFEFRLTSRL